MKLHGKVESLSKKGGILICDDGVKYAFMYKNLLEGWPELKIGDSVTFEKHGQDVRWIAKD
jgi:hypothetical protein